MFVKSERIGGYCSLTLRHYDRVANKIGNSRTVDREMHYQKVYGSREFVAQKVLNSALVEAGEGYEREEITVARVLSLWPVLKRDTEGVKLTFLHYMQWVPIFDTTDETFGSFCLQRTTADCREDDGELGTAMKEKDCAVLGEGLEQLILRELCPLRMQFGGTLLCIRLL